MAKNDPELNVHKVWLGLLQPVGLVVSPPALIKAQAVLDRNVVDLQPGEERRRSGSHYTPRELTEPVVRTTLRPVLEALGERPTPEQILDLKVCDPAMRVRGAHASRPRRRSSPRNRSASCGRS